MFFSDGGFLKGIYSHELKCHNRKPPLADRVSICNHFMSELEILATNLVNVKDSEEDIIPILGQYLNGKSSYSFCTICNHGVYNKKIHIGPHRKHCTEVIQGFSIRHWTKNNPKILCSPFDLGIQGNFCPQFWKLVQSKSLLLHQNKRSRTDDVAVVAQVPSHYSVQVCANIPTRSTAQILLQSHKDPKCQYIQVRKYSLEKTAQILLSADTTNRILNDNNYSLLYII
jgi:hypothetical protein